MDGGPILDPSVFADHSPGHFIATSQDWASGPGPAWFLIPGPEPSPDPVQTPRTAAAPASLPTPFRPPVWARAPVRAPSPVSAPSPVRAQSPVRACLKPRRPIRFCWFLALFLWVWYLVNHFISLVSFMFD